MKDGNPAGLPFAILPYVLRPSWLPLKNHTNQQNNYLLRRNNC